jgi:non-ribosomal peptide synthetase component E (peptide arylation enzyme)
MSSVPSRALLLYRGPDHVAVQQLQRLSACPREAIYKHPAVEEVAVIGIHGRYRGQSPKAFIKLKAEATPFKIEELQAFLRDKLGKHEMVRALEFRDELPKTPVGKISRKESEGAPHASDRQSALQESASVF